MTLKANFNIKPSLSSVKESSLAADTVSIFCALKARVVPLKADKEKQRSSEKKKRNA